MKKVVLQIVVITGVLMLLVTSCYSKKDCLSETDNNIEHTEECKI